MVFQEEVLIPALSGKCPRKVYIYIPDEEKDYEDLPEEELSEEDLSEEESSEAVEEITGEDGSGEDFPEEEERRYPVLYMFDGHNVFFDATATYGKCWGMKEYLEEHHVPVIVVAVECNHEGLRRLEEYSPYPGEIVGDPIKEAQGDITMDWFVDELKPMIDEWFPTLPDREHTAIAGSSMGGLMALYAAVKYNAAFSMAAALSPSVMVDPERLMEDIRTSEIAPHTRIYMDYGTEEGGMNTQLFGLLMDITGKLQEKGAVPCLRLVEGGTHSEASWEQQIPIFLRHLGLE